MPEPNTAEISRAVPVLHEIASLVGSLAWPLFALFVLVKYRKWISEFLPILSKKFETAESIEALGVKLTTAKDIVEAAVNQPAIMLEANGGVPSEQVRNAETLNTQLQSAGVGNASILASIEDQINRLATEYDSARSSMGQGPQRTREMNRIMGSFRTLGIAAKPLLARMTISNRPGERLAAIAVLQTEPDAKYIHWLGERFNTEQPFVFFHAALALRQGILTKTFTDSIYLRKELETALGKIKSFKGGTPDANTIRVLEEAIQLMAQ